jgi:hypothetical protein
MLPAMSAAEKKRAVPKDIALHYFATGTSTSRIEIAHLPNALVENSTACLITDGWNTVKNDPVVN